MKNICLPILILCAGCASIGEGDEDGNLKSGEVTQLAFTGDGKNLVVVNQFRYLGNRPREKCHVRLRRFATSSWKLAADTKELSLANVTLAPSAAKMWMIQGNEFLRPSRPTTDTIDPVRGPVFFQLDPDTLDRTPVDVIQQGVDNIGFVPSAVRCAPEKPLCVFKLGRFGGRGVPLAPFVFDLRVRKKTIDLEDYPSGKASSGDYVGPSLEFAPNGKHIASFQPSTPYQMQLHDAGSGKLVKSMKLKSAVGAIQFSPNGKLLAALCQDGTLMILHSDLSGEVFSKPVNGFTFEKYLLFPHAITFVGDGHLAVFSSDTKVELLDSKEWKTIRTFEEKGNRLNCLAATPDGKLLAAGFGATNQSPGFVRVWEAATGKLVTEFK